MPHPNRPELTEVDPIVMRRRLMIAALLGGAASTTLPAWAEAAARTPDLDHTAQRGSWSETFASAERDLDALGARYVTAEGAADRHTIMDSGLWLAAQSKLLAERAPAHRKAAAYRLASEACAFTAGCYLDMGNNRAATELYDRAFLLAQDHGDLRAFILTQWNWVPMYSGQWSKLVRRSDQAIRLAETHGGYALLMGYAHRAKACAVLGNRDAALDALDRLTTNIPRVPGAEQPHHALRYASCKAWFSASTVYAELGLRDQQNDAQHHALADPSLGWIDRNLMQLAHKAADPDPGIAAQRIRYQLLGLPRDNFNHCIKADAERHLDRIQARHGTNPEITAARHYLRTVQVQAA